MAKKARSIAVADADVKIVEVVKNIIKKIKEEKNNEKN